jgi:hypothetical protein
MNFRCPILAEPTDRFECSFIASQAKHGNKIMKILKRYVAAFGPRKSIGVVVAAAFLAAAVGAWANSAMSRKSAAEILPLGPVPGHGASELPTLR